MAAFIYEQLISDLQTLYASMGVQHTMNIYILANSSITEIMDQLPGEEWLLGNRTDSKLITSKIAYLGNNSLL